MPIAIPIVSKDYDSGFQAGFNYAKRYGQKRQPECGHIVANVEMVNLGSGELDEYCNMCLQIRNAIKAERGHWADRFEEEAEAIEVYLGLERLLGDAELKAIEQIAVPAAKTYRSAAKLLRTQEPDVPSPGTNRQAPSLCAEGAAFDDTTPWGV